ncbi:MAG: DNA mismatch repair protein MutS [Dehalococcoidia bacterium]
MTSPIRHQYLEIKRRYPQAIVLFRLGDFYETFDEDAHVCARELDITLTSKPMGKGQRVPLAGIPYHALDGYLVRLIAKGYKVAICEQMSDPATTKGLVDRQVVRVVTPGTVVEGSLLDERANNYLVALAPAPARRGASGDEAGLWQDPGRRVGLAHVDISTGQFAVTELPAEALSAELARLRPAELLLAEGMLPPEGVEAVVTPIEGHWFDPELAEMLLREHFQVASSEAFGLRGQPQAVAAAGAVLQYLRENQKACLGYLSGLSTYSPTGFMALDANTVRNLEIFAGGRDGRREGSLLGTLDLTGTAMGARLLRRWLGQPLLDISNILRRQELVEHVFGSAVRRERLQRLLGGMPDLERLCGRAGSAMATPREVVALRRGLELAPALREGLLEGEGSALGEASAVGDLASRIRPCDEVASAIAQAIDEEPGATLEQGGVVRPGFSSELDEMRAITQDVRRYLAELEAHERECTGIKSLRVGYNRVFGYYIEVSKPNLRLVPSDYERRQTLVGAERFVTPQLKEYEHRIFTARERAADLEATIFRQVCAQVAAASEGILSLAAAVAELDAVTALAEAAVRYGYVRPELDEGNRIVIRDGRHPMVERVLGEGTFVPNDAHLANEDAQIIVLTGPNMAGKSTYLRQVALIVLMAQVGSFVPASSAQIGVVDRIFTRVGAQEDIASGQSTFMVEMLETASILHNATPRSLIILDEIGRGTSTYDGMAIAQAVVEYLHNRSQVAAKTLFATHYHELTELAAHLPRVRNFNVAVTEEEGRVVFLRKILPGGVDRSYGVHVAELAGLPKAVVQRARDVLADLEREVDGRRPSRRRGRRPPPAEQLPLLTSRPALMDELASLDVDALTPLEAITKLYELRERAKKD